MMIMNHDGNHKYCFVAALCVRDVLVRVVDVVTCAGQPCMCVCECVWVCMVARSCANSPQNQPPPTINLQRLPYSSPMAL